MKRLFKRGNKTEYMKKELSFEDMFGNVSCKKDGLKTIIADGNIHIRGVEDEISKEISTCPTCGSSHYKGNVFTSAKSPWITNFSYLCDACGCLWRVDIAEANEEVCRRVQAIAQKEAEQEEIKKAESLLGVIRCKDCKWFKQGGCAIKIVTESFPKANDFCSFAERCDTEGVK